jgi:hypothetical protein
LLSIVNIPTTNLPTNLQALIKMFRILFMGLPHYGVRRRSEVLVAVRLESHGLSDFNCASTAARHRAPLTSQRDRRYIERETGEPAALKVGAAAMGRAAVLNSF